MKYCQTVLKLVLTSSLLILASCSNSSDPQVEELPPVTLEAKSGLLTGTADFGSFAYNSNSTKMVTFTLKNNGSETLIGPATIDKPENFTLIHNNCGTSLAKTKSCSIKVTFDPRNRPSGTYTANLNYDSVFVALSAVIDPDPNAANSVEFQFSGSVITSSEFGEITQKQSILRTYNIKNSGTTSVNFIAAVEGSSAYTLTYNGCKTVLAKGSSCIIKVTFNGVGQSGPQLANVTYGTFTLPLSGTVVVPAAPTETYASNIVMLDSSGQEIGSKNIGVFSGVQSAIVNVNVKNTGNLASAQLVTGLTDANNFQMLYDACSSQSLAINNTCLMKVSFGANGKPVGNYNTNVQVESKTSSLSAQVESYQCPDGQHLEIAGGPTNCVSDFKVCRTIKNGSGTQTWNGTDYGICKASSCNDGYILDIAQNKCVSGGDPCKNVAVGGTCSDGLIYAGNYGSKKVQTTPGYCTNSYSPTCSSSTPVLMKTYSKAVQYCQNLHYGYSSGFEISPFDGGQNWGYSYNLMWQFLFNAPGAPYPLNAWIMNPNYNGTGQHSYTSNTGSYWNATSDEYTYAATRCVRRYTPGCDDGFHNEGGSCVSDTRTCVGTNSTGTQIFDGTSWGTCSNYVCNSGFKMNSSNRCIFDRVCPSGETLVGDLCVNYAAVVCAEGTHKNESGTCVANSGDPCLGKGVGETCSDGLIYAGNYGSQKVQTTPGYCTNSTSPVCNNSNSVLLKTYNDAALYCQSLNYVYSSGFEISPFDGGSNWSYSYNFMWQFLFNAPNAPYPLNGWIMNPNYNGTGQHSYTSNTGSYWSATSDEYVNGATRCVRRYTPTCEEGYHNEGGSCASNIRACAGSYATGSQEWNGSSWGACSNYVCNAGFEFDGANRCVLTRVCPSGSSFDSNNDVCVQNNAPVVCSSSSYRNSAGNCVPAITDPCAGKNVGETCEDGLVYAGNYGGQKVQVTPGYCTNSTTPECSSSNPVLMKRSANAHYYCSHLDYVYSSGFQISPFDGGPNWGYSYNFMWQFLFNAPNAPYPLNGWIMNPNYTGSGQQSYTSNSGSYWNATSDEYMNGATLCVRLYDPSCSSVTHNEGGNCVPNTRSCAGSYSTGTQVWNGTSWGACSNYVCNEGYTMNSTNHCVLIRSCDPGQTYNPDLDICE